MSSSFRQKHLAASNLVHDLNNLFQHMQIRLCLLAKDAGPGQKVSLEALGRSLSLAIQRANNFLDCSLDHSAPIESVDLAEVIKTAAEAVDTHSTKIVSTYQPDFLFPVVPAIWRSR
jgi:hypothetical protein